MADRFSSIIATGSFMPANPKRVDRSEGARIFDLDGIEWKVPTPFYLNVKPTQRGEHAQFCGWATQIERTDAGILATGIVTKHLDEIRAGFFGRPFVVSAVLNHSVCDVEELPDGESAEVNGQTITGPCKVIRRCRCRAVWIVTAGCDSRTTFTLHEETACVPAG